MYALYLMYNDQFDIILYLCMYNIYVLRYVCMYVRMYVCMYVYVCMYICTNVCMYTSMNVCMLYILCTAPSISILYMNYIYVMCM